MHFKFRKCACFSDGTHGLHYRDSTESCVKPSISIVGSIPKKAAVGRISLGLACLSLAAAPMRGSPTKVAFTQSAKELEAYDLVEITANVEKPDAQNPFTDATLSGTFSKADGTDKREVSGFCDSDDGGVFRIRFMPSSPGDYAYSLVYRQGSFEAVQSGAFHASDGHRSGPIRVDPKYPWHFVWEGTGQHYFFNGTTAYFLLGWRDENTIRYSIDRLHRLKVNRLRVTIAGREDLFFGEPIMIGDNFTTYPTPWPAQHPEEMLHPGFDYSRFYLEFWRKFERALLYARDRDMIISLVLDMGDNKVHTAPGSEDEYRYIRYAVSRFGAFSNITWDLGDDLDRFRDDDWAHKTGTLIKGWDPYKHLATSHPIRDIHQDRASDWFDFCSFQDWNRSQHAYILKQRAAQEKTGRIIPQANEEYGYEDHYPMWAPPPDGESADTLRRCAWDIYMAGGYQTAGESAKRGTNIWPDTGGGWMNGRGDDTQTMFVGYGHIVEFFTSFEWWKADPHDELVSEGAYCLAKPGEIYAVYLPNRATTTEPKRQSVTIHLEPGSYSAHWFSATTGQSISLPPAKGPDWTSPQAPDWSDWALLLLKAD
jgi:hypothetical protein